MPVQKPLRSEIMQPPSTSLSRKSSSSGSPTAQKDSVPKEVVVSPRKGRRGSSSSSSNRSRGSGQNNASPTKSPRKGKRSKPAVVKRPHIAFADYDTVFQIPHINDMSDREIHDCWMTEEDLYEIRKSCIGTVRDMNGLGKDAPPEGSFLRGLDQHTDKYRERKDEINRQIYDAVARIQDFQRLSGKDATEVMAKLCHKYSEPSVVAAHMAAISDIFAMHKDTWSKRAIPDAHVFEEEPPSQGTYNY